MYFVMIMTTSPAIDFGMFSERSAATGGNLSGLASNPFFAHVRWSMETTQTQPLAHSPGHTHRGTAQCSGHR